MFRRKIASTLLVRSEFHHHPEHRRVGLMAEL
jgi:hypothetical protein